jgi:uncharacterized protein (TIGR03067 family)
MSLCYSQALLVALVFLAPSDADQALKHLQGTWAPDSVQSEGSVIIPDTKISYSGKAYQIEQDTLTIFFAGVNPSVVGKVKINASICRQGKLKINASVTPKQFDIVFPDGTNYPGIFAIDGDVLVVSLQWGTSKKRPAHFTTHPEDTEDRPIVYILRRQ